MKCVQIHVLHRRHLIQDEDSEGDGSCRCGGECGGSSVEWQRRQPRSDVPGPEVCPGDIAGHSGHRGQRLPAGLPGAQSHSRLRGLQPSRSDCYQAI